MGAAARVKNRVRTKSLLTVVAGYLLVVGWLYSLTSLGRDEAAVALLVVLYLGGTMLVAWGAYQHELWKLWSKPNEFDQHFPFRSYGSVKRSFHHSFYAESNLLSYLQRGIKEKLVSRGLGSHFRTVVLSDVDQDLTASDGREFCLATSGTSRRGTTVTLALHTHFTGCMQTVHWWILARGFVDQDRVFRFVALAPVTIPFWIVPYLQKRYDIIERVWPAYGSFYNRLDVDAMVRSLHDAVLEGLINSLDNQGVDTSELRQRLPSLSRGSASEDLDDPDDSEITQEMVHPHIAGKGHAGGGHSGGSTGPNGAGEMNKVSTIFRKTRAA